MRALAFLMALFGLSTATVAQFSPDIAANLQIIRSLADGCFRGSVGNCNQLLAKMSHTESGRATIEAARDCYLPSNKDPTPCQWTEALLDQLTVRDEDKQLMVAWKKIVGDRLFFLDRDVEGLKNSRAASPPNQPPSLPSLSSTIAWLQSKWTIFAAFAAIVIAIGAAIPHRALTSDDFGTPLSKQIPIGSKDFTILLRIRRSHRFTLILRRPKFILYFKADVSSEDMALIDKYKLGRSHLYTSEEFLKKTEEMNMKVDSSLEAIKKTLAYLTKWLAWIWRFFTLKITIRTLVRGKRVEKGSLGDLMALEQQVISSSNSMKDYLVVARTFNGAVETIEI
jgi:hypothetical protein